MFNPLSSFNSIQTHFTLYPKWYLCMYIQNETLSSSATTKRIVTTNTNANLHNGSINNITFVIILTQIRERTAEQASLSLVIAFRVWRKLCKLTTNKQYSKWRSVWQTAGQQAWKISLEKVCLITQPALCWCLACLLTCSKVYLLKYNSFFLRG